MKTKIIIQHDTVEALKASPLWAEIIKITFLEKEPTPVVVIEIEHDDEDEGE